VAAYREAAEVAAIPVTEIGEITAGEGPPTLLAADGSIFSFARTSFSHF
jgi:hypothetical protein